MFDAIFIDAAIVSKELRQSSNAALLDVGTGDGFFVIDPGSARLSGSERAEPSTDELVLRGGDGS